MARPRSAPVRSARRSALLQVGEEQVGAAQVGDEQVGAGQVGAGQVGAAQVGSEQVTKLDATSDLHLIMGEVHALVEMVVPSDEMGDIKMTPAILDQITAIQDAGCNALGLKRKPLFPQTCRPPTSGLLLRNRRAATIARTIQVPLLRKMRPHVFTDRDASLGQRVGLVALASYDNFLAHDHKYQRSLSIASVVAMSRTIDI